jgi:hypothetical protein
MLSNAQRIVQLKHACVCGIAACFDLTTLCWGLLLGRLGNPCGRWEAVVLGSLSAGLSVQMMTHALPGEYTALALFYCSWDSDIFAPVKLAMR